MCFHDTCVAFREQRLTQRPLLYAKWLGVMQCVCLWQVLTPYRTPCTQHPALMHSLASMHTNKHAHACTYLCRCVCASSCCSALAIAKVPLGFHCKPCVCLSHPLLFHTVPPLCPHFVCAFSQLETVCKVVTQAQECVCEHECD